MAAENNDIPAQRLLAILYEDGRGVTQDYDQAFKWMKKAAESDDVRASAQLALYYENGIGTKKDLQNAKIWMTKAASLGDELAVEYLEQLKIQEENSMESTANSPNEGELDTKATPQNISLETSFLDKQILITSHNETESTKSAAAEESNDDKVRSIRYRRRSKSAKTEV